MNEDFARGLAALLLIGGIIASFTLVGIVIGLPMLGAGAYLWKKYEPEE